MKQPTLRSNTCGRAHAVSSLPAGRRGDSASPPPRASPLSPLMAGVSSSRDRPPELWSSNRTGCGSFAGVLQAGDGAPCCKFSGQGCRAHNVRVVCVKVRVNKVVNKTQVCHAYAVSKRGGQGCSCWTRWADLGQRLRAQFMTSAERRVGSAEVEIEKQGGLARSLCSSPSRSHHTSRQSPTQQAHSKRDINR